MKIVVFVMAIVLSFSAAETPKTNANKYTKTNSSDGEMNMNSICNVFFFNPIIKRNLITHKLFVVDLMWFIHGQLLFHMGQERSSSPLWN